MGRSAQPAGRAMVAVSREARSRVEPEWEQIFRPGTRIVVLPTRRRARLACAANTLSERWSGTAFYPAYRYSARLYRRLLQISSLFRVSTVCSASDAQAAMAAFLHDMVADGAPLAVRIDARGPVQKTTIQISDGQGRIVAYLKRARGESARTRLQQEYDILRALPPGMGPKALKYGEIDGRPSLLVAAVAGKPLRAVLPIPRDVHAYVAALTVGEPCSLERHPWMGAGHNLPLAMERHMETLSRRPWAVVFRHGDLAPWNLLRTPVGGLVAIDWEYGRADGFPGLDVAQYVLQVASLIYRWTPLKARNHAVRELLGAPGLSLSDKEAAAIVSLAAVDAHRHSTEDGYAPELPLQLWRRAIWESGT